MTFNEAMQKALEASKYNYLTGKFEDLGEKIIEAIIDFIWRMLNFFNIQFDGFGSSINPNVVSGIFTVLAVIFITAVGAFVAWMVIRRKRRESVMGEIFDDFRSNNLTYEEVMNLVEELDKKENYREAVRYRYLGLIILFNAKEIVRVTDAMTGGQFIREVGKNAPQFALCVNRTVEIYYTLYFGNKSVNVDAYKAYVDIYNIAIKEAAAL